MRSFALTILASVAFGALSWAAPLNVEADVGALVAVVERTPLIGRDMVDGALADVDAIVDIDADVLRRDGSLVYADVDVDVDLRRDPSPASDVKSLVTIIVGVVVEINPLVDKLNYVKSDNCTESIIIPLVSEIIEILKVAVSDVECLVGESLEVVLGTVDGVLDCTGLAKLLGELLCLIFSAVGVVLKVVGVVARVNILAVLCDLATVVSSLIAIVLKVTTGIVGNLIGDLHDVIGDICPIILELRVTVLIDIIGLHL